MNAPVESGVFRVALTYDDGPTEHTLELLDVLDAAEAKATFFVRGDRSRTHPEVLQRMGSDPRIEIGNHSMTHPDLRRVSEDQVLAEVVDSQKAIESVIGRPVTLFRPPQGHFDERVRQCAAGSGQALILWTLTSLDWKHRSAVMTAHIVATSARDGDLVLLHDSEPSTVDGTRQFLARLRQQGVQFVTVSELFGTTEAGHHYRGRVSFWTLAARRMKGRVNHLAERFMAPRPANEGKPSRGGIAQWGH